MESFLSCDWGTSSFRLRLVEGYELKISGTIESDEGCSVINKQLLEKGSDAENRVAYFLNVLAEKVKLLDNQTGKSLSEAPIIISGMASSTAGMIEIPYKEIPFLADGSDLKVHHIAPTKSLKNRVLLISGVCSEDDVMRGEETKLVGFLSATEHQNVTLLLPGTHPKHVFIREGKVSGFNTYMTGEYFSLLSKNSLLSLSVTENDEMDLPSFTAGLHKGSRENLLHSSFSVRINTLFDRQTPKQNYHYLSGLLIGSELRDLLGSPYPIILLENTKAGSVYKSALKILEIETEESVDADVALIRGQAKILETNKFN